MEIYQINELYQQYEEIRNKFGSEETDKYNWIESMSFPEFCALRKLK